MNSIDTQLIHDGKIAVFRLPVQGCNSSLVWDLEDACADVMEHHTVRAIVLTSESKVFFEIGASDESLKLPGISDFIAQIEIPVIAAVDKGAHGLGLEVVLATDIRLCSQRATFSMPNIVKGFMPVNGGTQRLPRIVGQGRALELLITGREFDSAEALEMGLVQYVHENDVVVQAIRLAKTISSHGPVAARYFKEAVNSGIQMSIRDGMVLEADLSVILQSTSDRAEGINSFLNRRLPTYEGE